MFCLLDWDQLMTCRLVSSQWADFIDRSGLHSSLQYSVQIFLHRFVRSRHPALTTYRRWTEGQPGYKHLVCEGETRQDRGALTGDR